MLLILYTSTLHNAQVIKHLLKYVFAKWNILYWFEHRHNKLLVIQTSLEVIFISKTKKVK